MARVIDANVILRYILNDNEEMASQAYEWIQGDVSTTPEVLAEVVYVLNGVYKASRADIMAVLLELLNDVSVADPEVIKLALQIFAKKSLDFVDCILIAKHQINGDDILSFDKKLNHNLEVDFLPEKDIQIISKI